MAHPKRQINYKESAMKFTTLLKHHSPSQLGKAMRVRPDTVSAWKMRNAIPARMWQDLVRCTAKTDHPVTLEQLARAAKARR